MGNCCESFFAPLQSFLNARNCGVGKNSLNTQEDKYNVKAKVKRRWAHLDLLEKEKP